MGGIKRHPIYWVPHWRTGRFGVFAGETSSGKSSLVNLILGEEILPCCTTVTTSTICELKYGERPAMVVHFKDKDPETGETTKNIPFDEPFEQSSCRKQISTFVHKKGSSFKKVELFWPHDLLQVRNNGNRIGWSPILSVITRVINNIYAIVRFVSLRIRLQTELEDTYPESILPEVKKNNNNNNLSQKIKCARDGTYCPITPHLLLLKLNQGS